MRKKKRFQILSFSTISNDFRDFASEMSRGIAIDFGVEFALDLPHILPGKNSKTPTP